MWLRSLFSHPDVGSTERQADRADDNKCGGLPGGRRPTRAQASRQSRHLFRYSFFVLPHLFPGAGHVGQRLLPGAPQAEIFVSSRLYIPDHFEALQPI